MNSKYRKHVTYTAVAGVLTLDSALGGCTKKSISEMGDTVPSGVNVIQAMPEIIAQLGLNEQVPPGLNDTNLPDAEPVLECLRTGVHHEIIKGLQQRLMGLGFMGNDEPTDYFGGMTQQAVKHFQRQSEPPTDGVVGNVTWDTIIFPGAKYYAISKGAQDDNVERIQQCLYELGCLATTDLVTGNFGDPTEAAVLKLQEANGLEQDGKMRQRIINLLYSNEIRSNSFSCGGKSDMVLACQKCLRELGYLATISGGAYGEDTIMVVKQFQARNDQVVDSYLRPSTRIALDSPDARANGLMLGECDDAVTKVQQLLNKHGCLASSNVTRYYGEATESVVRNLQSHSELTSDGLVGVQTMAKLTGDNVGRPAANSSGSGTTTKPDNLGNSGNTGNNGGSGDTGKPSGNTTPPVSIPASGDASALISATPSKLELPYTQGVEGPNSFDYSGFIYWYFNRVGVGQGYLTSSGWRNVGRYTRITSFNDIQVGNITVVRGYIGIVAGGDTATGASSSNGWVVHRSLSQWWANNLIYV